MSPTTEQTGAASSAASTVHIRCVSCGRSIPIDERSPGRQGKCPWCAKEWESVVLPALSYTAPAPPPPVPGLEVPMPGEATCFYSPNRRATHTCAHCGVYVSEAWSAEWGTDHVCLKCLDELRGRRKDSRFESNRRLWDNIALMLALGPFLCCIPLLLFGPVGVMLMALCAMGSLVTAPLAVGFALYAWNKPRSLVPRGPWRVVLALVLGLVQCGAWAAILFTGLSRTVFR